MQQIQIIDWGLLDYGRALARQHQMVAERMEGRSSDRLVLVEHPPVVTIGRSGSLKDLRIATKALHQKGVDLHRVDRGGRATFHGPGQLVVYPIVKIGGIDLHAFLKRLLDTVAEVLQGYGLAAEFKKGKPGVWVNGAKIASVGLAVRNSVTYHGMALNVCTDPGWFDLIVPCGQPGEKVTAMDREMGAAVDISDVKKRFAAVFRSRHPFAAGDQIKGGSSGRPRWLVTAATDRRAVARTAERLQRLQLASVCQSARCPNQGECFERGTATFMILGTRCTRCCRFCAVDKDVPHAPDLEEPQRVARAVQQLGLSHAVVTSVTRDDLPDGGAGHFARTIRQIHRHCSGVSVEVLVPDFRGSIPALDTICAARPEVFNHNLETVPRLYAAVRPQADYRRSLGLLSYAASRGLMTKSGLMLGLGETENEIKKTLLDLKHAGCRVFTLGQYLPPSEEHVPVARYVRPQEFERWAQAARGMGFAAVASGPLVRSSYRAKEMMDACLEASGNNQIRKVS